MLLSGLFEVLVLYRSLILMQILGMASATVQPSYSHGGTDHIVATTESATTILQPNGETIQIYSEDILKPRQASALQYPSPAQPAKLHHIDARITEASR